MAHRTDCAVAFTAAFVLLSCAGSPATPGLATAPPSTSGASPAGQPPPVWTEASPPPAPREDGRLPPLARPIRYAVALDVDPRIARFGGRVRIRLQVASPTRHVVLHARGLTLRSIRFTPQGGTTAITGAGTERAATGGRGEPEELAITFERTLPAGEGDLEIAYDGPFAAGLRGLYRVHVQRTQPAQDEWYAYTQFEPVDARRAFPCFDEPGFKVPWQLTVTVPDGMIAVSNMPEHARTPNAATHTNTFEFDATPPTSSYLVALGVGNFDVVEGARTPVPVRAITVHGQGALTRLALEAAADHIQILARYFDRPYPYPKLDIVAVPEFGAGAMENPGLITFRDELLLLDPNHAPTRARRAMASVMAHELAHHWFGDLVTMAWWNDLWLNEGFATWMATRVVEEWRPAMGARFDALGGRAWAMGIDSLPTARAVRQPVRNTSEALEAFDGITYSKGAAVIGMIEHWLGADAFRNGIREYIRAHAWSNASADDLLLALGRGNTQNVAAVASSFLDQSGVPVVRLEVDCPASGTPSLRLAQSQYRVAGIAATPATSTTSADSTRLWRLPVCVLFDADRQPGHACVMLTEASATLPLTGATRCPRWVYPNDEESGYYRYELTPIVRASTTGAALASLDVRARVGFLDNAWSLVRGGRLHVDEFIDVLSAFRGQVERPLIESQLRSLGAIAEDVVDDALRPRFRAWLSQYLQPVARTVGWDLQPNEDEDRRLVRRSVLGFLGGTARDAAVLSEADRRAVRWLADPHSIESEISGLALPLASIRAGADRYRALVAALARVTVPADRLMLVGALGSFDDPTVLRQSLDAALTPTLRTNDAMGVVFNAYGAPERRATTFAWVREHFEAIRQRFTDEHTGRLAHMLSVACTRPQLDEMGAYLRAHIAAFEGAGRALRESQERAEQCIALREREHGRLEAYLQRGVRPATPRR